MPRPRPTTSHALSSGILSTHWENPRKQQTLLEPCPRIVLLSTSTLLLLLFSRYIFPMKQGLLSSPFYRCIRGGSGHTERKGWSLDVQAWPCPIPNRALVMINESSTVISQNSVRDAETTLGPSHRGGSTQQIASQVLRLPWSSRHPGLPWARPPGSHWQGSLGKGSLWTLWSRNTRRWVGRS